MDIIEKINDLDSENIKKAFLKFLSIYLTPAFGSISKRDIDISLFIILLDLGVFTKNTSIYEIVTQLRITRAKARNLLYESKLRQTSVEELDAELKEYLIKPIFLKNGDKICLEIDNPYLIDHLRYRLKELKHITDSSFSPELVQLTTDAFVDIFDFYIPEKSKDDIKEAFIQLGAESDKSFRGILKGVFKRIGARFAAEAGGAVAEDIGELLSPLLTNGISAIFERLAFVFQEKS